MQEKELDMGMAERMIMEQENRGYGHNDTLVCSGCVGSESLRRFVTDNGDEDVCGFCGRQGVCVTIERLCGKIMVDNIRPNYTSAANVMNYDSGEGGFHGATTSDTHDLLENLNSSMQLEEGVFEAVCNTMDADTWCRIDPYGDHEGRRGGS